MLNSMVALCRSELQQLARWGLNGFEADIIEVNKQPLYLPLCGYRQMMQMTIWFEKNGGMTDLELYCN